MGARVRCVAVTDVPRAIFSRFPALRGALPIVPLLAGPTPVHRVPELEALTGAATVFIKDDGRSATPYGGNKPRKLEWLFGDARRRGFSEIIAIGADGSNYCLATAIHGTRAGFDITVVTLPQPPIDEVRRNLLVGVATGATYVPTGSEPALLAEVARRIVAGAMRGQRPYGTWFGGSSPLGSVGFVDAGLELLDQARAGELPRPDVIFVPTGSAGSHAGLEVAMRLDGGERPTVVGVRVTPPALANQRLISMIANRCAALLHRADPGLPRVRVRAADLDLRQGFIGDGYGLATPAGDAATERLGGLGYGLDPTYSAKTMAALLAAGEAGELKGRNVVFWRTFNGCDLSSLPSGKPEDLPPTLGARVFG
jgi:D-cysteine desulfhydrase